MNAGSSTAPVRNVFACLVHDQRPCVLDLVHNLRYLDPDSHVLLFNGGTDAGLLRQPLAIGDSRVTVHPSPAPLRWGVLHPFAIDSFRYALDEIEFDTITIVDSDQLLLRPGWSEALGAAILCDPNAGMFGNAPFRQPSSTVVAPAQTAWEEGEMWAPFLSSLPAGELAWVHWTFWPSTVFTRNAAIGLVELFNRQEVKDLLATSRIWATEEILFPTFVRALGFQLATSPGAFDVVKYRERYAPEIISSALSQPSNYWAHPIARSWSDPLRTMIRSFHGGYLLEKPVGTPALPLRRPILVAASQVGGCLDDDGVDVLAAAVAVAGSGGVTMLGGCCDRVRKVVDLALVNRAPLPDGSRAAVADLQHGGDLATLTSAYGQLDPGDILVLIGGEESLALADFLEAAGRTESLAGCATVRVFRKRSAAGLPELGDLAGTAPQIPGWLEPGEAALVALAAAHAREAFPEMPVVEVGSLYGKATVVLARAAPSGRPGSPGVVAVDPHDGLVGALDAEVRHLGPTIERYRQTLAEAGVDELVETVVGTSATLEWSRPIAMLLVDGLHDYESVGRDIARFAPWLPPGGLIAFHDHAGYYPGVVAAVSDLLRSRSFERMAQAGSLVVLRRVGLSEAKVPVPPTPARQLTAVRTAPLPVKKSLPPLVSCIMPTRDRREQAVQAIAAFERQDYPERELVVIDDGEEPIEDLFPAGSAVRYLRIKRPMSIGTKRNLGCARARGSILVNWDDDDWAATCRVSSQVDCLLGGSADVCGLRTLLYCERGTGRGWRYSFLDSRTWLADSTLCYTRQLWERRPFPDCNFEIDLRFFFGLTGVKARTVPDERIFVGIIHPRNTSSKDLRSSWWSPWPAEDLAELMGADWSHYAGIDVLH